MCSLHLAHADPSLVLQAMRLCASVLMLMTAQQVGKAGWLTSAVDYMPCERVQSRLC